MNRIFAAAFAVWLLLCSYAFCGEETYEAVREGGVVSRGTKEYGTFALIDELNVAYFSADMPYFAKDVQILFTINASGGNGQYFYTFDVYRRSGAGDLFKKLISSGMIDENTYRYTPEYESGQYVVLVRITDSQGSYIEWQSKVYESSTSAAAVRAESIAAECRKNAHTDYARALWLHDWIINNADYDDSNQFLYADGVLLNGKGVCQSYALAYEMLLKMVGIDTVYVKGWAGGMDHAWNLVKIDGEWYHVDCMWDDPAPGKENHAYFCVPDEFIGRDHSWKHETQMVPESVKPDYSYQVRAGAEMCSDYASLARILDESLQKKRAYTEIWYGGSESHFDFDEAVSRWCDQAQVPEDFRRYRAVRSVFSLKVEMDFGSGFPDLTKPQSVRFDYDHNELNAGDCVNALLFVLPSGADKSCIILSSSDESVISIENGLIRAMNPGMCTISASCLTGAQDEMIMYVNSGVIIRLPASMTHLKKYAFRGCRYLETVIFPDGALEIGDGAFMNCTLLKTVSVPESVSYIGKNAFEECGRAVIECAYGSYAHEYALKEGIEFRLVSK